MNATRTEIDQRYKETHRAEINERQWLRDEARRQAKQRITAFMDALEELSDNDLREELYGMIEATAAALEEERKLKRDAARLQAAEFVAQCVWKGVTAPRRDVRAMLQAAAGD